MTSLSTTTHQRPLPPRKSAWAACCLSLLLVVTLFGIIDMGTGTLLEQTAREKLEQSLKSQTAEGVEQILTEVQEAQDKRSLFGLLREPENISRERTIITEASLRLRSALLTEDPIALQPAEQAMEQNFLALSRFDIPHAESLINTQRLIREHLTAHTRARLQLKEQTEALARISEEISALSSRFRLLHGDLNELFSLNLKLRPRTPDFSFYHHGALADLPVIHDVPDNLVDFVALREQLSAIGGKVRLEGDNANELFLQTIEQIRTQSKTVREAFTVLDTRRAEVEEKLGTIKEERRLRRERLLSSLTGLIISINS